MASYKAVPAVLLALKKFFELRMEDDLSSFITTPGVVVLGTKSMAEEPTGNNLGLYLHRVSVDPFGRNRYLKTGDDSKTPQPELPVNLHLLLVAWTENGANEGTLISWAIQQIGASLNMDIAHLGGTDNYFKGDEAVQVQPEDMSTEDLLRIWDGLPRSYILSVPFLVKTIRLLPVPVLEPGEPVQTIATPMGVMKAHEI